MPNELKQGDPAPDFRALAVGGKYGAGREVSLHDFGDQTLILYFYPKDNTPGCTTQACGLRDAWPDFEGRAEIFGVSIDSPTSHEKFIAKFQLPFPLLADVDRKIVEAYGVWVEKSMYGKKYLGAERSTFVIGGDGRIRAIFRKVKPADHADLLREALAE
ncbi:MAG: peroxiredoxin [Verrucomicrobiota bacterium]|nr:peroxiredoxin [Verrucomicrobiota bacterium]